MTLADSIPEQSVLMVSNQQGAIVHVYRNGKACEEEFSTLLRVDWMPS